MAQGGKSELEGGMILRELRHFLSLFHCDNGFRADIVEMSDTDWRELLGDLERQNLLGFCGNFTSKPMIDGTEIKILSECEKPRCRVKSELVLAK